MSTHTVASEFEYDGRVYRKGDTITANTPEEEMLVERLLQRGAIGGAVGGFDPGTGAPVEPVEPDPEEPNPEHPHPHSQARPGEHPTAADARTPQPHPGDPSHATPPMTTSDATTVGRRVRQN